MNRRSILKWMLGGTISAWIIGIAGAMVAYIKFPKERKNHFRKEIEVGNYDEFKVGEGKFVPYQKQPLWVIKKEGGLIALSAVCTHMKCILEYKKDDKIVKCPCHGGIFDLNGNVLSGPPPGPLKRYRVEVKGGKVYVIYG